MGLDVGTTLSPVLELRQYTLQPGQRDEFIDIFEAHFLESQDATGMTVIGHFRDLDAADRFVWLRGFPDMAARADSLAAFYDGPVWRAHRKDANARIIDSDDVLLLQPAQATAGFAPMPQRPGPAASAHPLGGYVSAALYPVRTQPDLDSIVSLFESETAPAIRDSGGSVLGYFVTNPAENTFPRLPVRTHELVFVWFAGGPDRSTLTRIDEIPVCAPRPGLRWPALRLRLEPGRRSLLSGRAAECPAIVEISERGRPMGQPATER